MKSSEHKGGLGDGPIEAKQVELMKGMAKALDFAFNGDAKGKDRPTGFVLLTFDFNSHEGRCNFISNGADRDDIVVLFKEMIARFEGQAELKGNA